MIPVAAILQARMTSTRLSGKALCPLAYVPLV
jgi:spore coat polysaccharide biosynthesis protein SpsF (cytidylyltransferase family)